MKISMGTISFCGKDGEVFSRRQYGGGKKLVTIINAAVLELSDKRNYVRYIQIAPETSDRHIKKWGRNIHR